jgi:L-threonylcarbamoyladenylate synthase
MMDKTDLIAPDDAGIARAAGMLLAGELVAFPTETVYGLGADATNERAVRKIFEAKGRPGFNPLIVHVADIWAAEALIDLPEAGRKIAQAFWPGPLTLVAPMKPGAGIAPSVTAGLDTLAVRVPANRIARELLRIVERPIAAPSANPSGRISPTTAAHVRDGLEGRIAAVLDGGPCIVGLESTIVGFEDGQAVLLRPGGVEVEDIATVTGITVGGRAGTAINAPGQLASHYAPEARLRLDAEGPEPGELWLGFGPGPEEGLSLSATGDLREAAARLFACLRTLDAQATPGQVIAVARIPEEGLGRAINDRLRRAAAPR